MSPISSIYTNLLSHFSPYLLKLLANFIRSLLYGVTLWYTAFPLTLVEVVALFLAIASFFVVRAKVKFALCADLYLITLVILITTANTIYLLNSGHRIVYVFSPPAGTVQWRSIEVDDLPVKTRSVSISPQLRWKIFRYAYQGSSHIKFVNESRRPNGIYLDSNEESALVNFDAPRDRSRYRTIAIPRETEHSEIITDLPNYTTAFIHFTREKDIVPLISELSPEDPGLFSVRADDLKPEEAWRRVAYNGALIRSIRTGRLEDLLSSLEGEYKKTGERNDLYRLMTIRLLLVQQSYGGNGLAAQIRSNVEMIVKRLKRDGPEALRQSSWRRSLLTAVVTATYQARAEELRAAPLRESEREMALTKQSLEHLAFIRENFPEDTKVLEGIEGRMRLSAKTRSCSLPRVEGRFGRFQQLVQDIQDIAGSMRLGEKRAAQRIASLPNTRFSTEAFAWINLAPSEERDYRIGLIGKELNRLTFASFLTFMSSFCNSVDNPAALSSTDWLSNSAGLAETLRVHDRRREVLSTNVSRDIKEFHLPEFNSWGDVISFLERYPTLTGACGPNEISCLFSSQKLARNTTLSDIGRRLAEIVPELQDESDTVVYRNFDRVLGKLPAPYSSGSVDQIAMVTNYLSMKQSGATVYPDMSYFCRRIDDLSESLLDDENLRLDVSLQESFLVAAHFCGLPVKEFLIYSLNSLNYGLSEWVVKSIH